MKRLILAAVLGLAACSSSTTDIAATIAAVQKVAMDTCKFLPYATTISAIIGKNVAGLKTAADIAKSICDAIKPSGIKSDSVNPPKVADVPVDGEFVGAKP